MFLRHCANKFCGRKLKVEIKSWKRKEFLSFSIMKIIFFFSHLFRNEHLKNYLKNLSFLCFPENYF